MHKDDRDVLEYIKNILKCGRLNSERDVLVFTVSQLNYIESIIIPLFDKCNIQGIKHLDYDDFRKVAMLLQDKQHLSEAGLSKIKSIKSNMNLNRKNLK